MQGEESVAAWVEQDEQRKTAEEAAARADVREKCFNSDRHRRIALDLARLRYVKMIAGTAIDEIKTMFNTWVQSAVEEFLSELEPMLEIPVQSRGCILSQYVSSASLISSTVFRVRRKNLLLSAL